MNDFMNILLIGFAVLLILSTAALGLVHKFRAYRNARRRWKKRALTRREA